MNEPFAGARRLARVELANESGFALGILRVSPRHCEVAGPGWTEALEPRVMQVLVALAREKGGVVSRDELIDTCWEGRVVGDDAISRCVWRIRRIAERSNGAFAVETVSRVGYRLKIADATDTPVSEPPAPPGTRPKLDPVAVQSGRSSWAGRTGWVAAILATLMAVAAGFATRQFWPAENAPHSVASAEASVAVLPFANMSGDPAKQYLSDGFSEEVLDDLSENPRLRVIARTSSFSFRDANRPIAEIARALHVRTIVEGSLREAGNRVRITAELVDAASGYRLWSARYDRELADVLAVQYDVARAIAGALTHRLAPVAAASAGQKIGPQSYRRYLQARRFLDENTPASARAALALLVQVTSAEPTFAAGFGALARAQRYVSQFDSFFRSYGTNSAAASESAQKALALDPDNLEARGEREAYELGVWNWSAAGADLRVLMKANPDNYHRLNGLRIYYYDLGFPEQALAVAERISALNPNTTVRRRQVVDYLNRAGANAEAVRWVREIVRREPDRTDMLDEMCGGYAFSGQTRQARDIANRLRRLASDWNSRNDSQDCDFDIDIATGDFATARRIVEGFESEFPDNYLSAAFIAEYYVYLRDFDKASDWFERSYQQRDTNFFHDVFWKPGEAYHRTARWKALTQEPAFREWLSVHDRLAAKLAAGGSAP